MKDAASPPALDLDKIRALGDLERAKILKAMIDDGPLTWRGLFDKLKMDSNSLNFHLAKLYYGGFILREAIDEEGYKFRYSISDVGRTQYELVTKREQHSTC